MAQQHRLAVGQRALGQRDPVPSTGGRPVTRLQNGAIRYGSRQWMTTEEMNGMGDTVAG
ncbi:hypothetical protein ACFQY4_23725 [Catellatospora bangladeshensis]|uniref:hypothetical protein n=1 Tax=Catellatospora bangladeshensis TaxID=310355 RepID=UPI00360ABC4D